MELHRSDVVQMSQQREETPTQLVIPDLDLVIITTRYDHGFAGMKIDTTNGTIVLFESINNGPDAIIPAVWVRVCMYVCMYVCVYVSVGIKNRYVV